MTDNKDAKPTTGSDEPPWSWVLVGFLSGIMATIIVMQLFPTIPMELFGLGPAPTPEGMVPL